MVISQIILGLLTERPMHGYQLHEQINAMLTPVLEIKTTAIYNQLKQLHRHGHIRLHSIDKGEKGERKIFEISQEGSSHLDRWLHSPAPTPEEIFYKVTLCKHVGKLTSIDILDAESQNCRQQLADLHTKNEESANPIVIHWQIQQIEACLRWLEYCQSSSEQGMGSE